MFRYFGAKHFMLKHILPRFPREYTRYVEPFGGSGKVLLAAHRPGIDEYYNDANDDIAVCFRVVKSPQYRDLIRLLRTWPSSLEEFNRIKSAFQPKTEIERAAVTFYITQNSRSGVGISYSYSTRIRNRTLETISSWAGCINKISQYHYRLMNVGISNVDYTRLIELDSPSTFWYIDPPYVHSTRTDTRYTLDMTTIQHIRFLNWVKELKGMVMISGYKCDLYNHYLPNFGQYLCPGVYNQASMKKERKLSNEVLYMNYINPTVSASRVFA